MIVYKITNKVNGKIYIGQTIRQLKVRWNEHKSRSDKDNNKLSRAIRKYGLDNFEISTIYEANDYEDLNKMEELFITQYNTTNTGYNVRIGGENSPRSKETREKMSKAKLGKKNPIVSESNKRRAGEKRNNKGYMGNTNSGRSVICINNSKTYISIAQAARELGVNKRSIHTVLSGRYKSVKGYSFRYL
jgi:group I intron endonuclease